MRSHEGEVQKLMKTWLCGEAGCGLKLSGGLGLGGKDGGTWLIGLRCFGGSMGRWLGGISVFGRWLMRRGIGLRMLGLGSLSGLSGPCGGRRAVGVIHVIILEYLYA